MRVERAEIAIKMGDKGGSIDGDFCKFVVEVGGVVCGRWWSSAEEDNNARGWVAEN